MAVKNLVELSSLTPTQVLVIELQQAIHKHEMSVAEALLKHRNSGVSKGTHYRILAQARNNIKKSLLTVIIAVQLGVVDQEEFQRLLALAPKISDGLDSARLEEITLIMKTLVDRIVML